MDLVPPPLALIEAAVQAALAEDLGLAGDLTTDALIPADAKARAALAARHEGVVAGLCLVEATFHALNAAIVFEPLARDGDGVTAGQTLATVSGPARDILKGERTALNFLTHLSGIATTTAKHVALVAGTNARIVCTRKTTPGLRAFQKYAVRAGGGHNHRFGLFDAILIKDNHIAACGGVQQAITRARAAAGHLVKIEVEIDRLDQLDEALAHRPDVILLDNMAIPDLAAGVARVKAANPAILCEASGGVRLETVRAIAETGVDLISAGSLTQSFSALDIGLDFE